MKNQTFKRYNERIPHNPCVLDKLSGKNLNMNGMVLSTSWSCSTYTVEKCEVAVWIKMTANIFAKLHLPC
jgi:hypothetical protein